jgi:hypothetical protein
MKIRNDLSLAVAVLLISGCLSAQVQLSDTPAAHQLSNWLTAFNSGDRATFLAFLQKNYSARAGDIDGEMGFREATGGFDLKQAGDCADTRCSAILKERDSDQFARIVVDIDPSEPHAIKGIELRAIPRPAEFSIPPDDRGGSAQSLSRVPRSRGRRRPFFRSGAGGEKWKAGFHCRLRHGRPGKEDS